MYLQFPILYTFASIPSLIFNILCPISSFTLYFLESSIPCSISFFRDTSSTIHNAISHILYNLSSITNREFDFYYPKTSTFIPYRKYSILYFLSLLFHPFLLSPIIYVLTTYMLYLLFFSPKLSFLFYNTYLPLLFILYCLIFYPFIFFIFYSLFAFLLSLIRYAQFFISDSCLRFFVSFPLFPFFSHQISVPNPLSLFL